MLEAPASTAGLRSEAITAGQAEQGGLMLLLMVEIPVCVGMHGMQERCFADIRSPSSCMLELAPPVSSMPFQRCCC